MADTTDIYLINFIHKYCPTKDFLLCTSADGMSTIANEKIAFEVKFVQIFLGLTIFTRNNSQIKHNI